MCPLQERQSCLACLHRSHHPCPSLLTQGFCERGGRQQAVSTGCPAWFGIHTTPEGTGEQASAESYGSVSTGHRHQCRSTPQAQSRGIGASLPPLLPHPSISDLTFPHHR